MFDAVVFAGGGNRCYWQGGFYEAAAARLGPSPKLVVGASAGAFAATYSLLEIGPATRARVIGACDPRLKNFDVTSWRTGKPLCPVGPLYSGLLNQTIDSGALRRLQMLTDFQVAVTRLPRGLSPSIGAAIGVGIYQLEKQLFHPVNPKFGRALGFRPEFVAALSLNNPQQLRDALMASSSTSRIRMASGMRRTWPQRRRHIRGIAVPVASRQARQYGPCPSASKASKAKKMTRQGCCRLIIEVDHILMDQCLCAGSPVAPNALTPKVTSSLPAFSNVKVDFSVSPCLSDCLMSMNII